MDFIGGKSIILNICALVVLPLFWGANLHAQERNLTPTEVKTLERNVRMDPKNVNSRRFLFYHYVKEKQWAKAIEYGQPIQAQMEKKDLLSLINALITSGDAEGALGVIGFYSSKFQQSAFTKFLAGNATVLKARKEIKGPIRKTIATEAVNYYKESVKLDPNFKESYEAWLATLREFWTDYHDDAIQIYKKMEAASGNPKLFLEQKCKLFTSANLWNDAVATCQESMEVYPEKVSAYANLATALLVQGDKEKARAVLLKAEKRDAKSLTVLEALAEMYFEENNYVQASEYYNKALKIEEMPSLYLSLALSEYQQKKYDEALKAFHSNCWMAKKVASEFINATGQLRSNNSLHNKYKAVMSSCQELKR